MVVANTFSQPVSTNGVDSQGTMRVRWQLQEHCHHFPISPVCNCHPIRPRWWRLLPRTSNPSNVRSCIPNSCCAVLFESQESRKILHLCNEDVRGVQLATRNQRVLVTVLRLFVLMLNPPPFFSCSALRVSRVKKDIALVQ